MTNLPPSLRYVGTSILMLLIGQASPVKSCTSFLGLRLLPLPLT